MDTNERFLILCARIGYKMNLVLSTYFFQNGVDKYGLIFFSVIYWHTSIILHILRYVKYFSHSMTISLKNMTSNSILKFNKNCENDTS